jgi:hypothetical protein
MRANFVVMATPASDDRFDLRPSPEPLEIQALITEFAIEALGNPILPSDLSPLFHPAMSRVPGSLQ